MITPLIIERGDTKLSNTIVLEQTAPMQLTFRSGRFVDTDGAEFVLVSDEVVDIPFDASHKRMFTAAVGNLSGRIAIVAELLDNVSLSNFTDTSFTDDDGNVFVHAAEKFHPKTGFRYLVDRWLVPRGACLIPEGTTDLATVSIPYLSVKEN